MFFQGYAVEGGEAGSLLKADVGCPPWVGPQSLPSSARMREVWG